MCIENAVRLCIYAVLYRVVPELWCTIAVGCAGSSSR